MSKNTNVPIASDLVVSGDPKMKSMAQQNHSVPSHIEELNNRIDELENAIGQDESGPIGRAYAIRAESNTVSISTEELDQTIDNLSIKEELLK